MKKVQFDDFFSYSNEIVLSSTVSRLLVYHPYLQKKL